MHFVAAVHSLNDYVSEVLQGDQRINSLKMKQFETKIASTLSGNL